MHVLALGASPRGGCLLPRPTQCGPVRTAPCAWRSSARHGRRRMRAHEHRRAAGTVRTRSAAAAMPPCRVMLRTASARCAARSGASTCTLEEWGPPWRVAVREYSPSRARPPGPLLATASEPYVSACARVRWTRVARGCALGPSRLRLGVFPSSPRPSVGRLPVSKKTVLPKKKRGCCPLSSVGCS